MDEIAETVERLSAVFSGFVPSPLPMPAFITTAATKLSELATSSTFPYRLQYINLGAISLWQAVIVIFLQPLIWNVIARIEYNTRILSKICLSRRLGVYVLAAWILLAGLYRDALYVVAMGDQSRLELLGTMEYRVVATALLAAGFTLVMSSFFQLGMTGTFLGDYFGFFMEKRVTGFPFNYFSDPMYDGSTMLFLSKAIFAKSPAGMLLSVWVYIVYRLACVFEGYVVRISRRISFAPPTLFTVDLTGFISTLFVKTPGKRCE